MTVELSKRQAEVLHWVQQGASNKVIARRLQIAESTVKVHVSDILKKYNASCRTQVAMSSTQGQKIVMLPIELDPQPLVWVQRVDNVVTAISLKEVDGWDALYRKESND